MSDSRRRLAPLLAAELISTTGSTMTALALPWLVLTTTGSPTRAGLVAAAEWIPMALLGIPSGAVAARLGARRTLMACDAARAPLVALVPVLYWLDALPFAALLALAFLIGAFFPAHFASQRTILPDLLSEEASDVIRGNVFLQAANRVPVVAGPALAGVLIGFFGAPAVLLFDAGTYVLAFVLLKLFVPAVRDSASASAPDESDLLGGVRYLSGDRLLSTVTAANAGVELAMQMIFLGLPILAFTAYDEQVGIAAVLLTVWGAGTLAGMPLAIRWSHHSQLGVLRLALVWATLPLWVLALHLPPAVLGVALFVAALANPLVNAPSTSIITLGVPEALRPKAMLAFVTAMMTAGGLGLIVTGPAAEALGAHSVLGLAAGMASACSLGFLFATRTTRDPAPDMVAHATTFEEAAQ
ncbi:MAG TPA: MFS transporter [Thermoleophilaceae bacterium]